MENNNDIIHSNETYDVYCVEFAAPLTREGYDYYAGYEIVHRATGTVEYRTTTTPDAIASAEQYNHFIVKEHWKWISESPQMGQEPEEVEDINPDGSPVKEE